MPSIFMFHGHLIIHKFFFNWAFHSAEAVPSLFQRSDQPPEDSKFRSTVSGVTVLFNWVVLILDLGGSLFGFLLDS